MKRRQSRLFWLFALCAAAAACALLLRLRSEQQRGAVYEELQQEETDRQTAEKRDTAAETAEETSETETEAAYVSDIDFDRLWELNPDIYAWITIPGTDISYPIVQHPYDSDYYLHHTVEKEEGYPGSIYTDSHNKKDLSRFNTLIYGHNMTRGDGSMFTELMNYMDLSFLESHREIIIDLPDARRTYQIFAAVVYDDRLITAAFDDDLEEDRQAYLDSIYRIRDLNSHVMQDVEVTPEDHIITLSTCIIGRPDNRFLVEAVLTDEER